MGDNTRRVQIITSDGLLYNRDTVEALMSQFPTRDSSVNVVSIIGPTGNHNLFKCLSGDDLDKPETSRNWFLIFLSYMGTLLRFLGNCLTGNMHRNSNHTSNRETTHGVYLSKSSKNPFMLIMEVQGFYSTTGKAQHGPSFEDRAALLTLSISDALLLSLPLSAIGKNLREDVPLRTIFKERLKLQMGSIKIVVALHDDSNPADTGNKTITDPKTIKDYENDVVKRMEKIWGNLHPSSPDIKFEDYFEVFVIVLPSHRESEELHEKLEDLELNTGADIYWAEKFPNTVQTNWSTIVVNKDVEFLPIKATRKVIAKTSVEYQSNNELQASQIEQVSSQTEQGFPSSIDNNIAESSRREGSTWTVSDFFKTGKGAQENVKIQMITEPEEFKKSDVENFMKLFPRHNKRVNVISIIGPQTTGKSSLLNEVFQTDFQVLDHSKNWGQQTKGIWISKSNKDPPMVIMDVEGSDARARAEGAQGTSFENKSALLALVTSNVMLLNLPSRAIDQHQGGCVPLLETIFKERLKFPEGKIKIVVTLRDCTNVKDKYHEEFVKSNMKQIWTSVNSARKDCIFEKYIEVRVMLFPHYRENKQLFESKCNELRKWLCQNTAQGTLPLTARNFSKTVQEIWIEIKNNKDLKIPSMKILLSERNCQMIKEEILAPLYSIEKPDEFLKMESASPQEFERMLKNFLDSALTRYDKAASGNAEDVQDRIKENLKNEILHHAKEPCKASIKSTMKDLVQTFEKDIPNTLQVKKESFMWSIFWCKRKVLTNVHKDECIKPYLQELEQLCTVLPEVYKKMIGEEKSQFQVDLMQPLEQAIEEIQGRHERKVKKWKLLINASEPALTLARAIAKPFVK